MAAKAKEEWARMSEDWLAEETGVRPTRRRKVSIPLECDENAMEVDEDMDTTEFVIDPTYTDHKLSLSGGDSPPIDDMALGYGVNVKYDPRPTISYDDDEVVQRSPPRIPRELTKRFKVHVDFDDVEESKPSVKSRLGGSHVQGRREEVQVVLPSPTSIKNRLGVGMIHGTLTKEDGEVSEEDSDDDNIKDNLEGHAWTKRLIGPRMRMYADEEFDKKKKQDSKMKLYKDKYDSQAHRQRSANQLRRILPSANQLDKNHGVPRKPKPYVNDEDEGRSIKISIKDRLGSRDNRVRRYNFK